jgi:hypothetical protein
MKRTQNSAAEGHINTTDIRTFFQKKSHNLDVAVGRSQMQGSSLVGPYG